MYRFFAECFSALSSFLLHAVFICRDFLFYLEDTFGSGIKGELKIILYPVLHIAGDQTMYSLVSETIIFIMVHHCIFFTIVFAASRSRAEYLPCVFQTCWDDTHFILQPSFDMSVTRSSSSTSSVVLCAAENTCKHKQTDQTCLSEPVQRQRRRFWKVNTVLCR